MRGLTLHQPYASLVAVSAKTIETRSWSTSYRGPLLIHAAQRWDESIAEDCRRVGAILLERRWNLPQGVDRHIFAQLRFDVRGHVLCLANLVDCRPMPDSPDGLDGAFGTFGPGRYGWILADVIPLNPPVPWKGMQGLWCVPPKLFGWVRGAMTREVDYVR